MSSIKTVPETPLRVSSGNDPTSTPLGGAVEGGRQLLMIRKIDDQSHLL